MQPTVSKHLRCCARPVSLSPRWTHGRLYRLKRNHFRRSLPGWLRSVSSGPVTWMLSNASTAWISRHREKEDTEKKMTDREQYTPGPAAGRKVQGRRVWTLILVRELRHSPESLASAHRPVHLRSGRPSKPMRPGCGWSTVRLTTVGRPRRGFRNKVTRADAHKVLGIQLGRRGYALGSALGGGIAPDAWTSGDRRFISMGAAGWHLFGRSGSASRRSARTHRRRRCPEVRRLAAAQRRKPRQAFGIPPGLPLRPRTAPES